MAKLSNQAIEQHYFEQFQKHYPLPSGVVEFKDKPDVLIRGPLKVGVEIANLYISNGSDPASEQVQRPRRKQVIEQAQALHQANGGKRIELTVDFQPQNPITKIGPVAKAIAALAMQVENKPSSQLSPILFKHIPELRFVYCNSDEYPDALWRSSQTSSVPFLSVERIREIVAEKTHKLTNYEKCDAYWLLLVVDFRDPAQDQELKWPIGEQPLGSPYERVLIYKPQFGQVLKVPQ